MQVKFDDIFGEPDPEVFSMDSVWSMANKVCYYLLAHIGGSRNANRHVVADFVRITILVDRFLSK